MSEDLQPETKNDKPTSNFMNKKITIRSVIGWIGACVVVFAILHSCGSSKPSVPAGMDENFYNNSLAAFHQMNIVYNNGSADKGQTAIPWMANEIMQQQNNPSDFTPQETAVIKGSQYMINALAILNDGESLTDTERSNTIHNFQAFRHSVAGYLGVNDEY